MRLRWLASTLASLLADHAVVLTHAYEGGHPDHDAVAFAVQATGRPRIEMTLYHAAPDGSFRTGTFLPGPPETVVDLSPEEQAIRTAMLDSFVTQRAAVALFRGLTQYRFRPAPIYDFTRPPAERVHYDSCDWGMTSARWCILAAEALEQIRLS
jgi:LmbE family N-acetylglucosaminyl deacetylase